MPSISLYRIPNADLSDASVQALILTDAVSPTEIPTRDIPSRLFIFREPPEVPEWAQYVAAIATGPLGIREREAIGAILLLKPDARRRVIYAVTWGSGRFHMRPDRLAPDWGLRCALNLISGDKAGDGSWDPARVRALRSKRVSQNTLIAEIQSSRKTTIDSFPFSVDVDQLRRVTGAPINSSRFGTTISGGISIHVKRPDNARNLIALCRDIERVHDSADYRRHFGWIDNVSPITDQALITQTYDQIVSAFRTAQLQGINLSPPTLIPWDDVAGFAYQWGHRKSDAEEPSIELFHEFMVEHDLLGALSADELQEGPKLHALDDNNNRIQSWPISRCLSGEFRIGTDAYILDDGTLLYVAADYLQDLNDFTSSIAKPSLTFPKMRAKEREDNYNKRISEEFRSAILLDKKTVIRPHATAIEVCDVATSAKKLIHVKRGTSSSSLSHLFAQGVVSAELLHMDSNFRNEITKLLSNKSKRKDQKRTGSGASRMKDFDWLHGASFEPQACEVVYAIMTERPREMRRDELPFFSKINLRMRCNELRRMGIKYSLALVQL